MKNFVCWSASITTLSTIIMSSFSSDWKTSVDLTVQPHIVSVTRDTDDSNTSEVAAPPSLKSPLSQVQGVFYPPWCGPERWESLNSTITYRPSDVIIATYPKCGTTWIEQVTLLLLHPELDSSLFPLGKNTYHPATNPVGKIWPEAAGK
jgi:hypothetical protein